MLVVRGWMKSHFVVPGVLSLQFVEDQFLQTLAHTRMSKVYQYKLVLLGESAVGKSSLVLRFVRNTFSPNQESTIGAAFLTQTLTQDDQTLKFEIWDTAGQERYHSLAPMYYRGAHAAVVVYDITNSVNYHHHHHHHFLPLTSV